MKAEKRTFLIMSLVAALVLVPMVSSGEEGISGPPPTPLTDQMSANKPPVGQPLTPEGIFAVQLVEVLRMGQTQDEAQAESMLSAVGIEPRNGWIAGYPVTPPMIGEIEKGVAGAADAGKLSIGKEQAMKALGDLKIRLGLDVTAQAPPAGQPSGPSLSNIIYKYTDKNGVVHFTNQYESIPREYQGQVEVIRETISPQASGGLPPEGADSQVMNNYAPNPEPEVINNYYDNEGPPVVTYYAPPDPYSYLYGWVPYPFWYSGFFFRGFFILNDFHRRVFFGGHPCFVTNHVGPAGSHGAFVVDPVSRNLRGGMGPGRLSSSNGFGSPVAQSSARTIVGLSQNRMASSSVSAAPRMANTTSSPSMGNLQRPGGLNPGSNGRVSLSPSSNFGPSRVMQGRTSGSAAFSGRAFSSASPRGFSSPSFSRGRSFSAPSYIGRNSSGGYHGGGGSFGGFHGGGGGGSRGHR